MLATGIQRANGLLPIPAFKKRLEKFECPPHRSAQEKFVQDFKRKPGNVKKALDTLDLDLKVESRLAKVGTGSVMAKAWTRSPGN